MTTSPSLNRPLLALAGLCGATGVGLAAAASHGGSADLAIAANFLLFHAPVLIGLSLLPRSRWVLASAAVMIVGLALFAGDLTVRSYLAHALFTMAAPLGGTALILGWLLLAATALFGGRGDRPASK
ncbi:MAG: DUF423 domain-containing protein [Devosia sp.]|nr:DUF423 domain-containing protein [Devosia sp.]